MAERLADEKAVGLQVPETVHNEYSDQDVTDQERRSEKALIRKLDCFIAPIMMLLMLISYLDRGNIGFAATQGMSADIRLKGSQLNVCIHLIIHPGRFHCIGMPHVNNAIDRSFGVLHFLHPRRISYLHLGQAAPIQPSHSHYHLLLGNSMPLYRFCSVVWLPCGVSHILGVFRRLPFPCYDLVSL